jgi:hypothetical protein
MLYTSQDCILYVLLHAYRIIVCCTSIYFTRLHTIHHSPDCISHYSVLHYCTVYTSQDCILYMLQCLSPDCISHYSVLHFYILHKIPLYAMPFTRLHIGSVLDFYSILYTSQACICCNVFHQIAYRIINVQHFYILHKIAYFTCNVLRNTVILYTTFCHAYTMSVVGKIFL